MISGAAIALVWANVGPVSYGHVADTLHFPVNDVAMVLFFGLAVKEVIEATAPGGPLHSMKRAALPVVAAIGGMAGPAVLYLALATAAGRPEILRGWAIPCATDIAFSYLVARLIFGATHPAVPFLLLLAIADDAMGLGLLAVVYPSGPVRLVSFAALLTLACAIARLFRKRQVRGFWPYLVIPGAVSWAGFYLGGLHPALALVPIMPFLPRPLDAFERRWSTPVEVILFFFALTNAGVAIGGAGPATWIVLAALVVGKPLGITIAIWLADQAGLRRPSHLSWTDIALVGTTAGIGFTVALFFTTAAFGPGAILEQAKLGALLSLSAGALAFGMARLLRAAA